MKPPVTAFGWAGFLAFTITSNDRTGNRQKGPRNFPPDRCLRGVCKSSRRGVRDAKTAFRWCGIARGEKPKSAHPRPAYATHGVSATESDEGSQKALYR